MGREEILKKAIKKAVKDGYAGGEYWLMDMEETYLRDKFTVIFHHDFAKSFWGEGRICDHSSNVEERDCDYPIHGQVAWQHHLQEMVLEKDPISYLEKFVQ